jgi:hypothetical protein
MDDVVYEGNMDYDDFDEFDFKSCFEGT